MVIPNEPLLTRTCLLLLPSHSTSYRRPLAVCNVMSLSWPRGTAILVFEEIDNSTFIKQPFVVSNSELPSAIVLHAGRKLKPLL